MRVFDGWAIIRSRVWLSVSVLAALAGFGCHKSNGISITIAPSGATVLINTDVQFVPTVTGSTAAVVWQVNSVTGGTPFANCGPGSTSPATVCYGTISTTGLYVAPSTIPANPQVTITATVSGTNASTTATVTITSGVAILLNNASPTVGTGETYVFSAQVTGIPTNAVVSTSFTIGNMSFNGCNSVNPNPPSVPSCTAVVWTLNGSGSINPTTGQYTAANSIANGASVIVTATSVYDTAVTGSAVVTLVQATDPGLVSVGPNTGSRGALFEDVYLSGTNFITTTNVFINGVQVPAGDLTVSSQTCSALATTNTSGTSVPTPPCTSASLTQGSTVIRVRVLDSFLAGSSFALPSTNAVSLVFTVARQQGSQIQCAPDPSACQLVLSPVRPSIVGVQPDTMTATSGSFGFTVDGGYYGTSADPMVTAQFNGQPVAAQVAPVNSANVDRQLTATVAAGQASQPGIYEFGLTSNTSGLPPATSNLTVQPLYSTTTLTASAIVPVGKLPSAIAINTATGIAVVANQNSNDVTVINLANNTVVASICTVPTSSEPSCAASAPTGVAIDNVRNVAVVTNSSLDTVSVVDLNPQSSTYLTVPYYVNLAPTINAADNANPANVSQVPVSVGINPLFGKALIAYRGANFGLILDLTPLTPSSGSPAAPVVIGVVNISTGANPRVAVAPNMNWALVTPGGLGALTVVNLSQQGTNVIAGAGVPGVSRSSGTVTVTTTTTLALTSGTSVLIQNVTDPTFDGIYTVATVPTSNTFTYVQASSLPNNTSGGGSLSFGVPVSSLATSTTVTGVAIDDINSQAILTDAGVDGTVTAFDILDQTEGSTLVSQGFPLPPGGMNGVAFNPLDDIAVTVGASNATGYVITPGETTGQNPTPPTVVATFTTGAGPWDVAIDPSTNNAVVINQTDNTATIVPLSSVAIRTPQILQVAASCGSAPVPPATSYVACGPGSNQIVVSSQLGTALSPTASAYLTITGSGFLAGTSVVRVDGIPLTSTVISSREITATLPASMQANSRRYAVDVSNSGTISNSLPLSVIQAVTFPSSCPSGSAGSGPASPIGVSIDAANNLATVTDINCDVLYVLNLAPGSVGLGATVSVGGAPLGVAAAPQGGLAVVANTGGQSVSLVNDLLANPSTISTITTEADPTDVAIDPVLGIAVVTANAANDLDVLSTAGTSGETYTATAVGTGPVPVAVDPIDHVAAVGNQTANTVSIVPLLGASSLGATTVSSSLPSGIAYDPATDSFIIESSFSNSVTIYNPVTAQTTNVNVGINPTSIAYNFATATLLTANSSGGNITVVDLLADIVREVIPLTSSSEFAMAIHPTTNLAVVADGLNSRVLLVPLP